MVIFHSYVKLPRVLYLGGIYNIHKICLFFNPAQIVFPGHHVWTSCDDLHREWAESSDQGEEIYGQEQFLVLCQGADVTAWTSWANTWPLTESTHQLTILVLSNFLERPRCGGDGSYSMAVYHKTNWDTIPKVLSEQVIRPARRFEGRTGISKAISYCGCAQETMDLRSHGPSSRHQMTFVKNQLFGQLLVGVNQLFQGSGPRVLTHNYHISSGNLRVCYWKLPFIVDFPIKMVIFHSYVSLPDIVCGWSLLYKSSKPRDTPYTYEMVLVGAYVVHQPP